MTQSRKPMQLFLLTAGVVAALIGGPSVATAQSLRERASERLLELDTKVDGITDRLDRSSPDDCAALATLGAESDAALEEFDRLAPVNPVLRLRGFAPQGFTLRLFDKIQNARKRSAAALLDCERTRGQRVLLFFEGGAASADLPRTRFLARERLGSGEFESGLVELGDKAEGTQFELGAVIDTSGNLQLLPGSTTSTLEFSVTGQFLDTHSSGGTFEPGTGFGLGIPGVEGGSSGFFLSAPPNEVTDVDYDLESTRVSADVMLWNGFSSRPPEPQQERPYPYGPIKVTAGYGLDGGGGETEEEFSGVIPGYDRAFSYDLEHDVRQFGVTAGIRAQVGMNFLGAPAVLTATATATPTYTSAETKGSLDFTGFETSTETAKEHALEVDVGAGLRFEVQPTSAVSIGAELEWESQTGHPVAELNGTDPISIDLRRADVFSATLRGSVRF